VLLVADDLSRPTPVHQFFAPVRDALVQAGARAEDIEILFALGVHRPMTEPEAAAKIGAANLARHRWHNHDAVDPARLVDLGTTSRGTPVRLNRLLTEFDLVVTLGALEPHLLLGFSGGAKMLLPGCAALETIGRNHLQGVADGRYNYVGVAAEGSAMRLDLEEGVGLLRKEVFIVNAVLNPAGQVVRFYCGDPRAAFRAGAAFLREHSQATVSEPADVVIANSRPFDADLRQGMKCVGNTLFASRPGGLMLGFVRCAEGLGDVPVPSWTLPYGFLRRAVRLMRQDRVLNWLSLFRPGDPPEQRFLGHFGMQMLRRNHIWVYSDRLEPGTGKKLGTLRQYPSVERMLADAVRVVGARATVAVFPVGGATYAQGPGGQA
jgi:nickel-dependent lactate racemase